MGRYQTMRDLSEEFTLSMLRSLTEVRVRLMLTGRGDALLDDGCGFEAAREWAFTYTMGGEMG